MKKVNLMNQRNKRKRKRVHETSDSEESDHDKSEVKSSDESELDVSSREKLEISVFWSVQRSFIAKQLPDTDKIAVDEFYAVVWQQPSTYYWGKVLKIFRLDVSGQITDVELKFMHRKTITSIPEKVTWDWPSKDDICTVKVNRVFMGPSRPNLHKSRFSFKDEQATYDRYSQVGEKKYPGFEGKK